MDQSSKRMLQRDLKKIDILRNMKWPLLVCVGRMLCNVFTIYIYIYVDIIDLFSLNSASCLLLDPSIGICVIHEQYDKVFKFLLDFDILFSVHNSCLVIILINHSIRYKLVQLRLISCRFYLVIWVCLLVCFSVVYVYPHVAKLSSYVKCAGVSTLILPSSLNKTIRVGQTAVPYERWFQWIWNMVLLLSAVTKFTKFLLDTIYF